MARKELLKMDCPLAQTTDPFLAGKNGDPSSKRYYFEGHRVSEGTEEGSQHMAIGIDGTPFFVSKETAKPDILNFLFQTSKNGQYRRGTIEICSRVPRGFLLWIKKIPSLDKSDETTLEALAKVSSSPCLSDVIAWSPVQKPNWEPKDRKFFKSPFSLPVDWTILDCVDQPFNPVHLLALREELCRITKSLPRSRREASQAGWETYTENSLR